MVKHTTRRTEKSEGQIRVEAVKAAFPGVEYIGGSGYCGPNWQQAAALDKALKGGR